MYPIYMFNTIAINITRAVILRFISWDGPAFLAICPLLMVVGLWSPIWFHQHVIARVPLLRKVFP